MDDLFDIPKPGREETLALVGWLTLCNAFGPVVRGEVRFHPRELPSPIARRWVGYLMSVARGKPSRRQRVQTVIPDRRRRPKVRRGANQ